MVASEGLEIAPQFVRRGWLAQQSRDFAAEIVARGRIRQFRRGEVVYRDGESPGGIYGVIVGGVGIIAARRGRSPVLAHIMRHGAWFGEGPWQLGSGRHVTFRATEAASLCFVAQAALEDIARVNSHARQSLTSLNQVALEATTRIVTDLLIPNAERRIAATLLRVTAANEGVVPDDPQGFIITQTEIGEMANVSRHHVNRTLTRFRAEGWVEGRYNRLRLLDIAALERLAVD